MEHSLQHDQPFQPSGLICLSLCLDPCFSSLLVGGLGCCRRPLVFFFFFLSSLNLSQLDYVVGPFLRPNSLNERCQYRHLARSGLEVPKG